MAQVTRSHAPAMPTGAPRWRAYTPVVALGLLLTAVAELLGDHTLDLGIGEVTLYPLIWGILLGGAASMQRKRPLPIPLQKAATHFVEVGVLLLAALLSFIVGQELPVLADAGPALLLQELGHLFGTVLFSLPVAVMLRMGRPTVGACFSIDREGSFAMVSERYGPDSDEYRGVLAMYIFGTVFGALYVTLLASYLASTGIFDPLALAMGTGVGSGSVMAASSAAIAAQFPAMTDQVLALAALGNLIASVLGLYVGLYVALPMAERFYRLLTRRVRQTSATPAGPPAARTHGPAGQATQPEATPAPPDTAAAATPPRWVTLSVMTLAMMLSSAILTGGLTLTAIGGFALMVALVVVAVALRRTMRLSVIIGVSTLGALLACPWSPVAGIMGQVTESIDFMALTTPVLVFAGLGIGKDAAVLRRVGWRIIPVGLVSFGASFGLSALIAEFALRL
jgi:Protein of unknown function (DUF3100)